MNFLRSSDGRAIILHFLCGRGNIIFGFRIQDFIVRRYQNPAYQEVYRKSKCEKTCPCRDSCCCGNRMFSFVYPGRSIQVCSGSAFYQHTGRCISGPRIFGWNGICHQSAQKSYGDGYAAGISRFHVRSISVRYFI